LTCFWLIIQNITSRKAASLKAELSYILYSDIENIKRAEYLPPAKPILPPEIFYSKGN
jgi:hypothetical protein